MGELFLTGLQIHDPTRIPRNKVFFLLLDSAIPGTRFQILYENGTSPNILF